MAPLSAGERTAAALLGAAAVAALLTLHRPWTGDPRAPWVWAGVAVAALLAAAGRTGRRGVTAAAAALVAAAPWDFAYPLALPYLALAIVLLVRRPRETA